MTPVIAQATLAWLLTYLVHSTVLLGGAWLLARSRRTTPAAADVMWKAALLGGVLTASLQGALERRPAGTFFLGSAISEAVAPNVSIDLGTTGTARPDGEVAESDAVTNESASQEAAAGARPVRSLNSRAAESLSSPTTLAATVWFAVALALVAWYAGRRLVLVGRLGDRRPVVDGETLAMLEELRRDTRARTRVSLTASTTISSPVALGGGEVCLPAAALTDLDTAQRRAMLAHELAHLERRDPQWLAAACLLERAFFFQPLNRLARRKLQENAEYLSDEWAARHSGGVSLAKALVKVAEWIQSSPLGVPVAGFAEERSQLATRVTRLLDGAVGRPRTRWGVTALATGALLATAAFAPGVSSGSAAPTDGASYSQGGVPRPPSPGRRAAPPAPPAVGAMPGVPAPAGRISMPGFGKEATVTDTTIVRAVMARLRDENAEVRRAAADALGRMRHPMAIDALVLALDDLDGDVRRAALQSLSNFEHTRVPAPPIRRMLENPDAEMRATAVRMLAEQRDRTAIPAITRLLTDPQEDVRGSALRALGELEAPVSEEALIRALGDRSAEIRESAANLAGERQVVAVVPQLTAMLDDRSGSVREQAAQALTEMRTPASHEALKKALTHRDPNVRRVAVEYFGEGVDP